MKQKGLGRGLDAIFGTDKVSVKTTPMNRMAEIAISQIIPNPTQPRTEFDEEAFLEFRDIKRSFSYNASNVFTNEKITKRITKINKD